MGKKIIDIDNELDRIAKQRPEALKCSFNMAQKIRKASSRTLDSRMLNKLKGLTILPSDRIPDHIIFLCDKHGSVLKMINLTETKAIKRIISIN